MIRLPHNSPVEIDIRRLVPPAIILSPDPAVRALAEFARRGVEFRIVALAPRLSRTKAKKETTRK